MGRRAQRRAEVRDNLLQVAFSLFGQHGYDDTTVEGIAEAAGVSLRTFYRYFPAKDLLLSERGAAVTEDVLRRVDTDPSVRTLVEAYADAMEEARASDDFELFVRLVRENDRLAECLPTWRQQWADRLATALAARSGHDAPPTAHRVRAMVALQVMAVALDEWIAASETAPIRDRALAVFDLVAEAVADTDGDGQ